MDITYVSHLARRNTTAGEPWFHYNLYKVDIFVCSKTNSKAWLTMLRQHSQYDSRLGFSFRVVVRVRLGLGLGLGLGIWIWIRVRVWVRVRVDFRVRVRIRVRIKANLTLTLTKSVAFLKSMQLWHCHRHKLAKQQPVGR